MSSIRFQSIYANQQYHRIHRQEIHGGIQSYERQRLGTFRKHCCAAGRNAGGVSFIQCFFLCFTDFGIPASVEAEMEVISFGSLTPRCLGSVPDFNNGAVVAVIMLLPSIVSISVVALFRDITYGTMDYADGE